MQRPISLWMIRRRKLLCLVLDSNWNYFGHRTMWHCPRVQRCLPPLLIQVGVSAGGRGAGGAYCWSAQRGARGRVLGSPLSRPLDAISAAHLHADITATFNYEYALTFELRKLELIFLVLITWARTFTYFRRGVVVGRARLVHHVLLTVAAPHTRTPSKFKTFENYIFKTASGFSL